MVTTAARGLMGVGGRSPCVCRLPAGWDHSAASRWTTDMWADVERVLVLGCATREIVLSVGETSAMRHESAKFLGLVVSPWSTCQIPYLRS
jgi:hypothetical protein